ncbi:uncharacterized protein [Physcomitrium patens]|uniref:RBR-type E3 ubiquitin transferase n=2 Tax=Physcomitrium patens TaxID=3218 RepID=A0A2K1KG44_PHYPA|nr:E3 ubiquitin-protein ligase RNF14-like [Physcomitrium patens]PNR52754.1 hypothetical protein PHYPA_009129 [Physcomitrium patens]|eukprot:XP_024378429.1 E3 ubiquitin-protein ligase RNF14-like [Physcomitrella patens]
MVWKAEGRSRGVPRYRRGVAGRQGYRDKVEYVYTPTREQGDDEAVDINLRQTGDGEMCEARQDIQPCDSSTPESISSQRNDADSGKGTVHDNDLGFREEVEEVGVKRLLKYAACIEEHPLSLSETENNKQQQDDEVMVLQSIYGSDYLPIIEGDDRPIAFMILVHPDIPEGIKIFADAPKSLGCDGASASVSGNDHSFTVQALPPMTLLCVFPPNYPSHSAPLYEITCSWLTKKKLSTLCTCLDKIWEETSPEVVVYMWSEWLRSQALSELGMSEGIELGNDFEERNGKSGEGLDWRAVSRLNSSNADVYSLLQYEESAKHKVFQESVHTCLICFSEYSGYSFTKLPCQHYFCTTCLKQYCNMHVKEGSVLNLNCPDTSCKEQIPPTYLKQLLDEEAFERWDNLSLQRALDAMADVVYCPKCKTASLEDPDHLVQCSQCRFSFCSLCLSNWHPGQTCMSPEAKLRILQSRRQGREMGEEAIKKEKELINECLDMDYIKREAKQCPTCRMAVQKSEGCNKMICTNCGGYFCFQCGKKIAGYDHFRGGSCILLDQLELNRWELQFNLQLQQLQEQDLVPRNPRGAAGMAAARPCPNCKQVNYKAGGNNHIFCWACQCHYCGLCNNVVRKGAGHFGTGPNKCKQHTPD